MNGTGAGYELRVGEWTRWAFVGFGLLRPEPFRTIVILDQLFLSLLVGV